MTKTESLQAFFSGFGMAAYPCSAVPDDVMFPYITYDAQTGAWGDGEIGMTVNLWFYTDSEAIPNAKAREISAALGLGGVTLPCDGGLIWLKRGSPWCRSLTDGTDRNIKRRYINISAEYLTMN